MEKEEKVALHLQISKALKMKLKLLAAKTDSRIKDIVIDAIVAYLKTQKSNKPK